MGRLTIDITENLHHHLRVVAASNGVSLKKFVLDRIMPDVNAAVVSGATIASLAAALEESTKDFNEGRDIRSFAELIKGDARND